jgi:hypothetical protein
MDLTTTELSQQLLWLRQILCDRQTLHSYFKVALQIAIMAIGVPFFETGICEFGIIQGSFDKN